MAMIRQADLESSPRQALVLNVENIRAQADLIMDHTRAAAAAIIADATKARERILAGAAEAGRAQGHAEGLAKGLAEGREQGLAETRAEASQRLAKLESAWTVALGEFIAARESLLRECEQRGLDLAILMGRRVARRAIETDRESAVRQVAAILDLATRGTRLSISISAADEALVRDALPGLLAADAGRRHVDVAVDGALAAGSCTARGEGGGVLDARLDTLIDSLVREIVPGHVDASRDAGAPGVRGSCSRSPGGPGENAAGSAGGQEPAP